MICEGLLTGSCLAKYKPLLCCTGPNNSRHHGPGSLIQLVFRVPQIHLHIMFGSIEVPALVLPGNLSQRDKIWR